VLTKFAICPLDVEQHAMMIHMLDVCRKPLLPESRVGQYEDEQTTWIRDLEKLISVAYALPDAQGHKQSRILTSMVFQDLKECSSEWQQVFEARHEAYIMNPLRQKQAAQEEEQKAKEHEAQLKLAEAQGMTLDQFKVFEEERTRLGETQEVIFDEAQIAATAPPVQHISIPDQILTDVILFALHPATHKINVLLTLSMPGPRKLPIWHQMLLDLRTLGLRWNVAHMDFDVRYLYSHATPEEVAVIPKFFKLPLLTQVKTKEGQSVLAKQTEVKKLHFDLLEQLPARGLADNQLPARGLADSQSKVETNSTTETKEIEPVQKENPVPLVWTPVSPALFLDPATDIGVHLVLRFYFDQGI
jgi:hypothetical protein